MVGRYRPYNPNLIYVPSRLPNLQLIGGPGTFPNRNYPQRGNGKIKNWFNHQKRNLVSYGNYVIDHPEYLRNIYKLYNDTLGPVFKGALESQVGPKVADKLEGLAKSIVEKGLDKLDERKEKKERPVSVQILEPEEKHDYPDKIGFGKTKNELAFKELAIISHTGGEYTESERRKMMGSGPPGSGKTKSRTKSIPKAYANMTDNEKMVVQDMEKKAEKLSEIQLSGSGKRSCKTINKPSKKNIDDGAQIILSDILASLNR